MLLLAALRHIWSRWKSALCSNLDCRIRADSAPSSDLGFICCHEVIFPVSIFLSTGMLMSVSGFPRLTIRAIASVAIFISFGKNSLSSSDWRSCAESMRVVMARRTLSVRRRLIASFSLVFSGMMPAIVYIFSNTSPVGQLWERNSRPALISTTPVVARVGVFVFGAVGTRCCSNNGGYAQCVFLYHCSSLFLVSFISLYPLHNA